VRGGLVGFAGRVLLAAAVPLSLIWVPLGRVPGFGNVTASDVGLIALWVLTVWALILLGFPVHARSLGIILLSVLIGVLAGLGSELSLGFSRARGSLEFFFLMKRFGLASILPLAAVIFRARAMAGWTGAATLSALFALAVFAVIPEWQVYLPRPEGWNADELDRVTGLVTNPNDLAYAAVGLVILHGACVSRWASVVDRLMLGAALVAFATCAIVSASRSGLLGAAGALAFILLSPRVGPPAKIALAASALLLILVGFSWNSGFENRVSRALRQGGSEQSVSSRLDAQRVALKMSLDHPLGVGFTGFGEASSTSSTSLALQGTDSVYLEALLGAGFLGLAALVWLFHTAWKHIGYYASPADLRTPILRSGLVAFFIFGTASVSPFSVFLSPLFFSIVAAAAYSCPDQESER
jgi:O-antigen ligase